MISSSISQEVKKKFKYLMRYVIPVIVQKNKTKPEESSWKKK